MGDSPGVQERHNHTPAHPGRPISLSPLTKERRFIPSREMHTLLGSDGLTSSRHPLRVFLWGQFPKPEKDLTSPLGVFRVSLDSFRLQSYFLFSLIQLTFHSGRGTPHGSEAPEANGKGTILPSLPLIFHAILSPHLTPLLNSPLVSCCLRSLFTLWWSLAVPTKLEYFSQVTVKRYKER